MGWRWDYTNRDRNIVQRFMLLFYEQRTSCSEILLHSLKSLPTSKHTHTQTHTLSLSLSLSHIPTGIEEVSPSAWQKVLSAQAELAMKWTLSTSCDPG